MMLWWLIRRKLMIAAFAMLAFYGVFSANAYAQAIPCPENRVCITPDQARQALIDADTVKAQEKEILALKQANLDQRELTVNAKLELARIMGEKTAAEQQVVRLTAMVEFLQKNGRKKCGLFSICIQ